VPREPRPFDPVIDYRKYVDGRPREAGVRSFLAARGISLPHGSPDDGPEVETLNGLGNRKDRYFIQTLAQHGIEVYERSVSFVRDARARGVRTAIISSSQNCAAVLGAAGFSQLVRVDGIDLRQLGLQGKPAPDMCNRFDVAQIQKTSFEFSLLRGCSGGSKQPQFLSPLWQRELQPGQL
jgi:trehalose 6-phosphate phosphatase